MSVSTTNAWQQFTSDGSTAYFAFNFNFVDASEIIVGVRDPETNAFTLIDASEYQLIQNPDSDGGQVRFIQNPSGSSAIDNPPAAGAIIRIERGSALTSSATWQLGLEMVELVALFDRVFRLIQENKGRFDNTIQTFPTQQAITIQELLQANDQKVLYFDVATGQIKTTDWAINEPILSDTIIRAEYVPDAQGHTHLHLTTLDGTIRIIDAQTLHGDLDGREDADSHPASAISTTDTKSDVQTSLDSKVDDLSVNPDLDSTVILDKSKADGTSVIEVPLPVATADTDITPGHAGVMNAAQATALQEAVANIDNINQRYFSASGLSATPSQIELTNAWQTSSGISIPSIAPGARLGLNDITNGSVWDYFTDIGVWTRSSDSSLSGYFTNTSGGIIHGSTLDGQLSAEPDGTGSVVGWDSLKATANNAWNAINNFLTNTLGLLAAKATDFLTAITSTNKGLTQADAISQPTSTNKVLTQADAPFVDLGAFTNTLTDFFPGATINGQVIRAGINYLITDAGVAGAVSANMPSAIPNDINNPTTSNWGAGSYNLRYLPTSSTTGIVEITNMATGQVAKGFKTSNSAWRSIPTGANVGPANFRFWIDGKVMATNLTGTNYNNGSFVLDTKGKLKTSGVVVNIFTGNLAHNATGTLSRAITQFDNIMVVGGLFDNTYGYGFYNPTAIATQYGLAMFAQGSGQTKTYSSGIRFDSATQIRCINGGNTTGQGRITSVWGVNPNVFPI